MASALSNGIRRIAARLSPDPTPDGELLSRFLTSRDEAAFAELVRRHGRMVFSTCRRVLGNATDADDAFQAAFVVLVRKADSLTGRACVGNFLYATAVFTARKARTMATRRRSNEAKAVRPEAVHPPGVDDEATRVLDEELAGLPAKYREPVVLCDLEGVSRREAAARLGIPEGTISSRLATAHRMLAKRLAARGFAAVAVTAVLGKQAFAVPDTLADAAVRAVAGGPPAGVTQLVAEVTKMLLWHKLRSGAAVLAGAALVLGIGMAPKVGPVATAAPVPKKAENTDAQKLHGRWASKGWTHDPPAKKNSTPPRYVWTFDEKGLHTEATVGEQTTTGESRFAVNPDAEPKELTISGKDGRTLLQCIYALDGDTLKVAFYGVAEKARPSAFTAKEDMSKGAGGLIVIEFDRDRDHEIIQGSWQAVAAESDGKKAPDEAVKAVVLRFKGTEATFPGDLAMTFALDPKAKPKGLTLTPTAGPNKGVKVESVIYELSGDDLKVCVDWGRDGKAGTRPTDFTTAPRDGRILLTLKRVKEEKKDDKKEEPRTPDDVTEEYTWNDAKRTRVVRAVQLGGEKVEFVRVPRGQFTMGSPESDKEAGSGEKPQHQVTFTRDLWVAKHPVTNGQFAAFVKATGYKTEAEADGKGGEGFNGKAIRAGADFTWREIGWEQTDRHPVVNVTWNDAAKYCEWAAKESKVPVRLPAEAEYEYAARGGAETVYPTGDAAASLEGYANVTDASAKGRLGMGWAVGFDDGEAFTSPVGKYKPNGFGLYDMTGNVWSWCADWSDGKVYARGDVTDPGANADGQQRYRVLRGGSWYDHAKFCRAACRSAAAPDGRTCTLGFRVVFAADPDNAKKEGAKKADEPAWKATFNKAYGLKDGELVKRVAPPYPDCRTDYFRSVLEWHRKRPPTDTELAFEVDNFTVFNWKDGTPSAGWQTHATPDEGVSLQFVLGTVLELHTTRIRDDANALNQKITGDFVVRTGADREKLAAQLEAILRKELELPLKFTFEEVEEDVFVLSGKYEAKPVEGRKAEQVEVYSAHLTDRSKGGGGGGTFAAMVEAVERHVNRPIVLDKVEGVPARVFWHFNCRDANDRIKYAQDTHPPTVLDNLAAQTGLTVKEEKRKVRKLVIEHAELKK